MIRKNDSNCPNCEGALLYYDSVIRHVRTKNRVTNKIKIRRLRCTSCSVLHRELPASIFPYKQYESEIILGVLEELITSDTLGYENYPCEMTMNRWVAQKTDLLLYFQLSTEAVFTDSKL